MKRLYCVVLMIAVSFGCQKPDAQPEIITLTYTTPDLNQPFYNNIETTLLIKPSGNVKKVEYFLDGQSIGSAISSPYSLKWTPKDIAGGSHLLTAVATSDLNTESKLDKYVTFLLRLGDSFKGGRIFYLESNAQNGLIAATNDLEFANRKTFFWGPKTSTGANADGQSNTKKMAIVAGDDVDYAGYHFRNGYLLNGFNDWFIPSSSELNKLKENRQYIDNVPAVTKDATYFSSSELSVNEAYGLNLNALIGENLTKNGYSLRIRPIRKF